MNTPDAGRIRVRWYRVPDPPPGSYELTDYSSSNFDGDTYSYNPAVGEESTTRQPFVDWRDCCPPPWFGWRDDICPTAVTPCAFRYKVPKMTLAGTNVPEANWPARTMPNTGPCQWASGPLVIGTQSYNVRFGVVGDGSLLLVITLRQGILTTCVGTFTAPGPVDLTQPNRLLNVTVGPLQVQGPPFIIVTPIPDDVLGIDPCTGIITGAGAFILAT